MSETDIVEAILMWVGAKGFVAGEKARVSIRNIEGDRPFDSSRVTTATVTGLKIGGANG